jgi:hypothetical protein
MPQTSSQKSHGQNLTKISQKSHKNLTKISQKSHKNLTKISSCGRAFILNGHLGVDLFNIAFPHYSLIRSHVKGLTYLTGRRHLVEIELYIELIAYSYGCLLEVPIHVHVPWCIIGIHHVGNLPVIFRCRSYSFMMVFDQKWISGASHLREDQRVLCFQS